YACSTPFPPDDRSLGWERGSTVSKEWDQATTDAALETAAYVAARANEFVNVRRDDAPDRKQKLQAFCHQFAQRAFRKPLRDDQQPVVGRQFNAVMDPQVGVKRVVVLVLKSPRFLYREVGAGSEAYDVASRLSFGLWDSIPDRELLEAAAAGRLSTKEQVA